MFARRSIAVAMCAVLVPFVAPVASAEHCPLGTLRIEGPLSGPVGSTVSIAGCKLAHASEVYFYDEAGQTIRAEWGFADDEQAEGWAIVPAGAVRGVALQVNAGPPVGTDNVFVVSPTLSAVSPTRAEPNTFVKFEGSSLGQIGEVRFGERVSPRIYHGGRNGERPESVLYALVPTDAQTGAITLAAGGTSYPAGGFTVLPATPRTSTGSVCVSVDSHPEISGERCGDTRGIASAPLDADGSLSLYYKTMSPMNASWGSSFRIYTLGATLHPSTVCVKVWNRCYPVNGTWYDRGVDEIFEGQVPFEAPAGSHVLRIDRADGIFVETDDRFTIDAPAFFTLADPPRGKVGDEIRIHGANVGGAARVSFAGIAADAPTSEGSNLVKVRVPPGARSGPLMVTMPSGDRSIVRTPFIVLSGPPLVAGFLPTSVTEGEAPFHAIAVQGSNFGVGSQVRFCASGACTTAARAVGTADDVVAMFPRLAAGAYDVEVRNAGSDWVRAPGKLTIVGLPTINGVSPTAAFAGLGSITVTGTHFVGVERVQLVTSLASIAENALASVFLATASASNETTSVAEADFRVDSPTSLTFAMPANLRMTSAHVLISTSAGHALSADTIDITLPTPPFRLTDFGPKEGRAGESIIVFAHPSEPLTLCLRPRSGDQCFVAPPEPMLGLHNVLFGSARAGFDPAVVAGERFGIFTVPPGLPAGEYTLVTKDLRRNEATSASLDPPTYRLAPHAPEIASVSPASGPSSTTVTIKGTRFVEPLTLLAKAPNFPFFVPMPKWTLVDSQTIEFNVPLGSPSGPYTLKVTTAGGEGVSEEGAFTVPPGAFSFAARPPTLTAFTPSTGATGATLTITGTNFARPSVACLQQGDDCHLLPTTIKSTTELEALVPSAGVGYAQGQPGSGPNIPIPALPRPIESGEYTVRVVTLGGQADSSALSPATFTLTAKPFVALVTPPAGIAGTEITIRGASLAAATRVRFGDAEVPFEVREGDIIIRAPSGGGIGPRTIEVTTPGGASTALQRFLLVPELPRIDGFTPAQHTPRVEDLSPTSTETFTLTVRGERLLEPISACLMGNLPCVPASGSAASDGRSATFRFKSGLPPGSYFVQVTTLGGPALYLGGSLDVALPSTAGATTQPPPRITSFTPKEGATPLSVDIFGSGFATTYGVQLRAVSTQGAGGESFTVDVPTGAVNYVKLSPTHLRAKLPDPLPPGRYVLAVHTLGGVATTRQPNGEGVGIDLGTGDPAGEILVTGNTLGGILAPPTITAFSPAEIRPGETLQGSFIRIDGKDLLIHPQATIVLRKPGQTTGYALIGVGTPASLTANVPRNTPAGEYLIEVGTYAGRGNSSALAPSLLRILPAPGLEAPEIARIETATGPLRVTVYGKHLSSPYAACLDGPAGLCLPLLQQAISSDGTWVRLSVPSVTPPGSYTLSIQRAGGTATSASKVTVPSPIPEPSIASVGPALASHSTKLFVRGSNFPPVLAACLSDGASCHPLIQDSAASTWFMVTIPQATPVGTYKVRLTSGPHTVTSTQTFTLVQSVDIDRTEPAQPRPGEPLTIFGKGFANMKYVHLGARNLTGFQVSPDGTRINVNVPASATPADIILFVAGFDSSDSLLVQTRLPRPVIESWTPTTGPQGTEVTIQGRNLAPLTKVCLRSVGGGLCRGLPPAIPGADPSRSLRFYASPSIVERAGGFGAFGPGIWSIELTTPEGTFKTSDLPQRGFVIPEPPSISGLDRTSASPGDIITISGARFISGSKVFFGLVEADTTRISTTQLKARVPSSAGVVPVKVQTSEGAAIASQLFTYAPRIVALTSVTPNKGAPGTLVTVDGAGLAGVNAVELGGVAVSDLNVISNARLTFRVPAGAPEGFRTLIVKSPGSPNGLWSFQVLPPPPTVTGTSRSEASPDAYLWIYGTNLRGITGVCLKHSDGCTPLGYPTYVRPRSEPADSHNAIYVKLSHWTHAGRYSVQVTTTGGVGAGGSVHVPWDHY